MPRSHKRHTKKSENPVPHQSVTAQQKSPDASPLLDDHQETLGKLFTSKTILFFTEALKLFKKTYAEVPEIDYPKHAENSTKKAISQLNTMYDLFKKNIKETPLTTGALSSLEEALKDYFSEVKIGYMPQNPIKKTDLFKKTLDLFNQLQFYRIDSESLAILLIEFKNKTNSISTGVARGFSDMYHYFSTSSFARFANIYESGRYTFYQQADKTAPVTSYASDTDSNDEFCDEATNAKARELAVLLAPAAIRFVKERMRKELIGEKPAAPAVSAVRSVVPSLTQ